MTAIKHFSHPPTLLDIQQFNEHLWDFYTQNRRPFPWRDIINPYHVLISEIMLQQTQTHRVLPKFEQFLKHFPTLDDLARASTADVINAWQGLGYNRRALFLQRAAQEILETHSGMIPSAPEILETLPGIGKNTAGSIAAFAYNTPTIFIETNIRTVFITSFFITRSESVHDKEILPLIEMTLDREQPRDWYYALMDYGVYLKKELKNPSRKSTHHTKQSKFEGSNRQTRGFILKALTTHYALAAEDFQSFAQFELKNLNQNLKKMVQEGFLKQDGLLYSLA